VLVVFLLPIIIYCLFILRWLPILFHNFLLYCTFFGLLLSRCQRRRAGHLFIVWKRRADSRGHNLGTEEVHVRVLHVAVRHNIAPLVSSVPQPQGGSGCPVLQGAGQSADADGTVVVVAVRARQRRARARRDEVPILKRTYDVRGSTT
jgi:hypothetical protein